MTRRALVVGIDKYPRPFQLACCVNDARWWGGHLESRGFTVRYLLDAAATADAIVNELGALVHALPEQSVGAFVNSSHGSNTRDDSGDEPDGRDECLVGVDLRPVLDDTIGALLEQLRPRVGFTLVSDSCHSGGFSRFAALPGAEGAAVRSRFLAREHLIDVPTARAAQDTETQDVAGPRMTWIEWAACRADQLAWERNGHGDFTRAAKAVIETSPRVTGIDTLHRRVLAHMGPNRAQTPMLLRPDGAGRRTLVTVPRVKR